MSLRSNFPKISIYSSKIEPIFMLQEFFAILTQLSSIFHLASIYSSKIEPIFPLPTWIFRDIDSIEAHIKHLDAVQQQMSHLCVSFGFKISVHI